MFVKNLGRFSPICLCSGHQSLLQEPENTDSPYKKDFSFLLVPAKGIPSPSRLQWREKDNSESEWEDG